MFKKQITALFLAVLMLTSLVACAGSGQGKTDSTTTQAAEQPADQGAAAATTTIESTAAEAQNTTAATENLVIGDKADGLSKAEREKGYEIYFPLGVKFLLDPVYKEFSSFVKRRHLGTDDQADDPVFFSRAYYFRTEANSKAYAEARKLPDGQEKDDKLAAIKKEDRPLFGFFSFKPGEAPKDEADLVKTYGFEKWEKLADHDGYVQYFARGKNDSADLQGKDKEVFEKLYGAIDQCRASVSTFTPAKPETSFLGLSMDQFKAKTITGKDIDKSFFEGAPLTIMMYWISWCPDCLHQMEAFSKFINEAEAKGIRFIGVCADLQESQPDPKILEDAKAKIKEAGLNPETFTTCYDSTALEDAYFIRAMNYPTLFYVDSNGKIIKAFVAEDNLTAERFNADLEKLIAEGKVKLAASNTQQQPQPAAGDQTPAPTDAVENPTVPNTATGQDNSDAIPNRTVVDPVTGETHVWQPPDPTAIKDCNCGEHD